MSHELSLRDSLPGSLRLSSTGERLLSPSYRAAYGEAGFDAVAQWRLPDKVAPSERDTLVRDRRNLAAALADPCTIVAAKEALQKLANLCRHQTSVTQDQARHMIAALAQQLIAYPAEIVAEGCKAYSDTNAWFPAWADLRAILEPKAEAWRLNLKRLDQLIDRAGEAKLAAEQPRHQRISEEQRAEVQALIGRLANKTPPAPQGPGSAGVIADRPTPRYVKEGPKDWEEARRETLATKAKVA